MTAAAVLCLRELTIFLEAETNADETFSPPAKHDGYPYSQVSEEHHDRDLANCRQVNGRLCALR